jgi:4a-hydroxytetrahydrobiopterin dehydratase
MLARLSDADIDAGLKLLANWQLDADKTCILKEWKFDSFAEAMRFFVQVGELAQSHDHHPQFLSNYTQVKIRLSTHDANGLTEKDFKLAQQIDLLQQPFDAPQH